MRWSYKTVHYELKKEGLLGSAFLDESEMELSLNEYGKAGWELVSLLETMNGLVAVFKQPLSLDSDIGFFPQDEEKQNDVPELQAWGEEPDTVDVECETPSPQPSYAEITEDKDSESEPIQVDVGSIRIE